MQDEWKRRLIIDAVNGLVSALGPKLEPAGRASLPAIYQPIFEVQLNELGSNQEMATEVFRDIVKEKTEELAALNLSELKQAVRLDAFRAEVLPLDQAIETAALSLVRRESIDSATRENIGRACVAINALGARLDHEFPELRAELGPKISDSLLDCEFIRNGGAPTSLRLNRAADR